MENEKKNNGTLVGILIGIIITLLAVICLFATGIINFKSDIINGDIQENSTTNNEKNSTLTEQEALKIGKELYDKATEVYETWFLLPYCGLTTNEIFNRKTVNYKGGSRMYESKFNNLDELKSNLETFLSKEIVDNHIKETPVTDLSLLEENGTEYTNYAIINDKLYCRANTGKGWMKLYLNNYDITVKSIDNDTILFDIKSAYVKESVAQEDSSKCTYNSKFSDCTSEQIEYKNSDFTIKKINETWKVTDYLLHD